MSEPAPERERKANGSDQSVFALANGVDTVVLLDRLSIAHETNARGKVMAQCPGCSEDGALVCEDGGLKCLHDRCSQAGPAKFKGFRSNIDLVMLRENCDKVEAAKKICSWFGIDVPEPRSRSNGHIRNGGAANGNTEPPPPDDYEHDDADAPDAELSSNDSSQDKSPESQPSAPRPKPSGLSPADVLEQWARAAYARARAASRPRQPHRARHRGASAGRAARRRA